MTANRELPALNPLKARSTIAALLTVVGAVSPLLGGGIGALAADVVANSENIQAGVETATASVNALIVVGGMAWLWFERRAPNFRLSFRDRP